MKEGAFVGLKRLIAVAMPAYLLYVFGFIVGRPSGIVAALLRLVGTTG